MRPISLTLLVRGLYRLPTAPAGATTIQTSDTPEVRGKYGSNRYLLQPCHPDLPRPPSDEQDQRTPSDRRVRWQARNHFPEHPQSGPVMRS